MKYIKDMKNTNRGLSLALNQLKDVVRKDRGTNTAVSLFKFVIKKHIEELYLFDRQIINSYSECDYVVKFWGPLVEKAFKNSSIIPRWGDTIPETLLFLGIKMKMDLRLIAVNSSVNTDNGYGEVAKKCSSEKYFHDKRKAVIASKALLNSIIQKNVTNQENYDVYIPYLIAMGFEMHLCVVYLKSDKLYITKKVKTITFPSNLNNFAKDLIEVVNGILNLVDLCEAIRRQSSCRRKRKTMDSCINNATITKEKDCGTSKVIWDKVKEKEMEDEDDDDDDEADDDEADGYDDESDSV